ncbi:ABC transporter substrate-binding protein [Clostridium carboxidivorans P7]|uniref:4-phytase n=1 Tax=Clostridium carboxidivorans P7 TaxID=536227 RepID=C6PVM2_9CLOT|nr:ABC transporter substrate-binding protein [Clostridium carboxidivorans]AKN30232.1 ABC transporter substrate-binding protein [Clostridium carboxidivorans P7]EET86719.1 4-phytase [Clostridium carboxidivorans P7]
MKKKFLSAIMAAFLAGTFLTGCGGGTASQSSKSSKTLVFAQSSDPRGLDPAYADDGESAKVMCNVYEGLIAYKEDSTEIQPCLAEKWNISSDGKVYTFNLRKNVKFHDGTPFNADAVVYNIERQLPPKAKDDMPYASFTFGEVAKVEKVDDYTVKITLKEPYTPFLANLAMSLAAPMASPTALKKSADKIMENPVGTGPFKFVKWTKSQSIELEKNNDYWGTKANLDKVVFKFIKENSVRASELISGSVDAIDGIDPNDIKKIKDSKLSLFQSKGMNINYMGFMCSRAPFNDPKLREALSYAINRDELVKQLYQGYSEVANSPLPSFIPGYNKDVKPYEYNPEKAKAMLKELGKENLKIKILTYSVARPYNSVNGQKLAESVQAYLAKVGVTATIDAFPWKEYKDKLFQGEGDMFFYGWIGDNGDADNFLSLFDTKEIKSTLNSAKYSNAQVDELLAKGRTTPNGDERNKIYSQIQDITAKDVPWLPISHAQALAAYSPKVTNFKVHPTGSIFFSKVDKN